MVATSPITSFKPVIAMTSAKKYGVPPGGVRIGVIKNDPVAFPDFSAPALASVFEYGTAERFRMTKRAGFITGRASTGSFTAKPWLRNAIDITKPIYISTFTREAEKIIE